MSMSKSKKERREIARRKARIKKTLIIIGCVIVAAGLTAVMVFAVDWENFSASSSHVGCTPDNC